MNSASAFSGVRVEVPGRVTHRPAKTVVKCQASQENTSRRQLLGAGLMFVASVAAPAAQADIIDDLKARSEANKALNDRKRLATSYANLARSRTLRDGTCQFPNNFFGCDIPAVSGNVKYITDDIQIECQGNEAGTCAERPDLINVGP